MIPNHARFLDAIRDKLKVSIRFYSLADCGTLDRVCAPIEYGQGAGFEDGMNRYWFWDYESSGESHTIALVPGQILDLRVLGEVFNPAELLEIKLRPVAAGLEKTVTDPKIVTTQS